jgi:hypothetical protein
MKSNKFCGKSRHLAKIQSKKILGEIAFLSPFSAEPNFLADIAQDVYLHMFQTNKPFEITQ